MTGDIAWILGRGALSWREDAGQPPKRADRSFRIRPWLLLLFDATHVTQQWPADATHVTQQWRAPVQACTCASLVLLQDGIPNRSSP